MRLILRSTETSLLDVGYRYGTIFLANAIRLIQKWRPRGKNWRELHESEVIRAKNVNKVIEDASKLLRSPLYKKALSRRR